MKRLFVGERHDDWRHGSSGASIPPSQAHLCRHLLYTQYSYILPCQLPLPGYGVSPQPDCHSDVKPMRPNETRRGNIVVIFWPLCSRAVLSTISSKWTIWFAALSTFNFVFQLVIFLFHSDLRERNTLFCIVHFMCYGSWKKLILYK